MADEKKGIRETLLEIQRELKVGKEKHNDFGGFNFRSKEDILNAVKPLAHERGCVVICDDEVRCLDNGWVYVVATATLVDAASNDRLCAHGAAREPESKKGMDASQISGCAASYAGKRALGNLFALDDTKDSDGLPPDSSKPRKDVPQDKPFTCACSVCGNRLEFTPELGYKSLEQINENAAKQHWCCPAPSYEVV